MLFVETPLPGAFVVELELREDERGFLARSWCRQEFEAHGLDTSLVQCNISFNKLRGTLRGLHFQAAPHAEAKLVRCVQGRVLDVFVDLRPVSPTFLKWHAVELDAITRKAVFIPQGFAHGFQTLEDNSELFYQMSEFYHPECARGLRWNDPDLAIPWPLLPPIIGPADAQRPFWHELKDPLEQ